ncbi:MAG: response regulator transcription factor [Bacteroidota bacterium]
MNKSLTSIVIVDSDMSTHETYRNYFSNSTAYELLEIYSSISDLLAHPVRKYPDIIVSETTLPGISGLDGIEFVRKRKSNTKILMMSEVSDFSLIREAFKRGADGFLTKPIQHERFFNAMDSLQRHGAALGHDIVKKIIHSFQSRTFDTFSKKENQIIELLTQGFTYKMIADKLCVTPSAVNFHIQNIYVKLNVNSKSEALEKLRELESRQLNAA